MEMIAAHDRKRQREVIHCHPNGNWHNTYINGDLPDITQEAFSKKHQPLVNGTIAWGIRVKLYRHADKQLYYFLLRQLMPLKRKHFENKPAPPWLPRNFIEMTGEQQMVVLEIIAVNAGLAPVLRSLELAKKRAKAFNKTQAERAKARAQVTSLVAKKHILTETLRTHEASAERMGMDISEMILDGGSKGATKELLLLLQTREAVLLGSVVPQMQEGQGGPNETRIEFAYQRPPKRKNNDLTLATAWQEMISVVGKKAFLHSRQCVVNLTPTSGLGPIKAAVQPKIGEMKEARVNFRTDLEWLAAEFVILMIGIRVVDIVPVGDKGMRIPGNIDWGENTLLTAGLLPTIDGSTHNTMYKRGGGKIYAGAQQTTALRGDTLGLLLHRIEATFRVNSGSLPADAKDIISFDD